MMFARTSLTAVAGTLVLALACGPFAARADAQAASGGLTSNDLAQIAVSGELVVGVTNLESCGSVLMSFPLQILCIDEEASTCRVKFLDTVTNPKRAALIEQIAAQRGVTYVEPLYQVISPEGAACGLPAVDVGAQQCTIAFADGTPTEEEYTLQESLGVTGFTSAQQFSKHYKSVVAVIDTGIDPTHPALVGHLAGPGYDFLNNQPYAFDQPYGVDKDGDGYVDEAYGHGTHLSSLIALLNEDARILPARVLDSEGNGNAFDVARAIRWATDRGARIINLSLSISKKSLTVAIAIEYAKAHGVRFVVSAGNTSKKKVLFPANYSKQDFDFPAGTLLSKPWQGDLEAVGSIGIEGVKADFSAWGPEIDLVAPGVGLYGAMPGGGYAWWSGTSMSTAVVTGVLSLLDSISTPGSWSDTESVMGWTAMNVDSFNPDFAGDLGHGMPNAYKAALWLAAQDKGWGDGWGDDNGRGHGN